MKLLLIVFFVFFLFSLLVIVNSLLFVASSSPTRLTFVECKQIVSFSSRQTSLPALKFGNFSRDTSCDSIWPMKSSLHASCWPKALPKARSTGEKRICPISWGIFKLLAVFISLAVMGWFNLLTKRLIMPSCDEIETKMASRVAV